MVRDGDVIVREAVGTMPKAMLSMMMLFHC